MPALAQAHPSSLGKRQRGVLARTAKEAPRGAPSLAPAMSLWLEAAFKPWGGRASIGAANQRPGTEQFIGIVVSDAGARSSAPLVAGEKTAKRVGSPGTAYFAFGPTGPFALRQKLKPIRLW